MKKILILGASGGIGTYLVEYILQQKSKDIEVIGVGRSKNDKLSSKIDYIQMDISQKEAFDCLPNDIYAVIDLAGAMPARMKGYSPQIYINSNIVGTFNVLEYCVKNCVDRILFSQSFGDIKDLAEKDILLTPDMLADFKYDTDHALYIISKNTSVEMIKCYHAMYGIKAFIFRLPTIYSWSENDYYYVNGEKRVRAWRHLIELASRGEPIEVWGDPNRKKDMVYVKDFCQMLYKACFVNRQFGHYNVGTGVGTTLLDQIEGMIEVFGKEKRSKLIMRPDKPNAPQYIMDISNAKEELAYEPRYPYIEMLKDMRAEKALRHS